MAYEYEPVQRATNGNAIKQNAQKTIHSCKGVQDFLVFTLSVLLSL